MMEVQKYLKENGLQKLQDEFKIVVTDYPDIVVLNYNQIESNRFHPIVDECRALILEKDTWNVVARSFSRFYNLSEGVQQKEGVGLERQRIASFDEYATTKIDFSSAIVEEKLDGSIISMYFYNGKWNVSTRKMGYAEGQTNLGRTFSEVFFDAIKNTQIMEIFQNNDYNHFNAHLYTYTFEMVGPENRVVKNYPENKVYLIGIRDNVYGNEYTAENLDKAAMMMEVSRPKYYKTNSLEELIELVKTLPTLDEGFVVKIENKDGSHFRIKVKNPAYLAIAHLRGNGMISPKRILALIMSNDYEEYIVSFPEDKKYFDFVQEEYNKVSDRIFDIYEGARDIKDQKEFALTIIPKVVYSFESGVIFQMRKTKDTLNQILLKLGHEKIAKGMDLKKMFVDKFHVNVEEEEG